MTRMTRSLLASVCSLALAAGWLLLTGCASTQSPKGGADSTAGQDSSGTAQTAKLGGAQLWARNCGHCHNIRSPSSYSDAQWDVVMLHMRVRANLTAEEHRQILAFMKTAH